MALEAEQTRSERLYKWIVAALDRGATVYVSTYLHTWKLTRKHAGMIRYHDGHCEMQHGRNWDIIDLCAVSATE
ncbi:MAG: hypothetical protein WC565_08325 [Parcubacteria group bacterium]